MNLANTITLTRILLIPVFVALALYYSNSVEAGTPHESLRLWAIAVFVIAAVSDAVDGYIARNFNQRTRLGAILDPLADKLLMLAAVGILSFSAWPVKLPLWFVVIVVAREVFSTMGAFVINYMAGKVTIDPHWMGKTSTFFGLVTIASALLSLQIILPWVAALAAFFAFSSGMIYIAEAVRQINSADHGNHSK